MNRFEVPIWFEDVMWLKELEVDAWVDVPMEVGGSRMSSSSPTSGTSSSHTEIMKRLISDQNMYYTLKVLAVHMSDYAPRDYVHGTCKTPAKNSQREGRSLSRHVGIILLSGG